MADRVGLEETKLLLKQLVKLGYLTKSEVVEAVKSRPSDPLECLQTKELVNQDMIDQATADVKGLDYVKLDVSMIDLKTAEQLGLQLMQDSRVVPIKHEGGSKVAVSSTDNRAVSVVESKLGHKMSGLIYASDELITDLLSKIGSARQADSVGISGEQQQASVVVDSLLHSAYNQRASDIHIEPGSSGYVVRFRIDGVLHDFASFDRHMGEKLINRVKVMSHLRIDEHDSVQDGSIRVEMNEISLDVRVSVAPLVYGQKIVMRLLDTRGQGLLLPALGMDEENRRLLEKAISKTHGLVVVVGPTGSGKTTTLYATLRHIERPEINITTIEDPVEYRVDRINQIQVNNDKGISFASGLRSIVRQDPDVILVGEIRDRETAEIAVNAALTGHLVLTTFHANDAATAVPRLLDMGVEPFLLASTLELVVGQRLIRTLEESGRVSKAYTSSQLSKLVPEAKRYFGSKKTYDFYTGVGQGPKEYNGRTGVFEVISVDDRIRQAIMESQNSTQIWARAKEAGAKSMFEDGSQKVLKGLTTIEELTRVVPPES